MSGCRSCHLPRGGEPARPGPRSACTPERSPPTRRRQLRNRSPFPPSIQPHGRRTRSRPCKTCSVRDSHHCRQLQTIRARCGVSNARALPQCGMEWPSTHEALPSYDGSVQPVTEIVPAAIDRRRRVKPLLQRLAGHRVPWRNWQHHDPLRRLPKQFFRQELLLDVVPVASVG